MWAFIERFGISVAEYDQLTVDRFESGIAYIEASIAQAQKAGDS